MKTCNNPQLRANTPLNISIFSLFILAMLQTTVKLKAHTRMSCTISIIMPPNVSDDVTETKPDIQGKNLTKLCPLDSNSFNALATSTSQQKSNLVL